mmetsp:Transcript_96005/g.248724  ORF Transcript_96005/g.248724 Transcript_96005/m.248724 type:complete len:415 (+) Transcript_96005:784-2028(+)
MALATSLHSALVGAGLEIMDSNIWVATITGLPAAFALMIMSFCTNGTSSGFISTPRSPRATMTPSEASRIFSRSSTADGFSIFANNFGLAPREDSTNWRNSSMSSCLCTKDSAIQSTSFLQANSMSVLSFGVIGEIGSTTSGVLTPLRALNLPPTSTVQSMKGGHSSTESLGRACPWSKIRSSPFQVQPVRRTRILILPSSSRRVLPDCSAIRISGCGSWTRCWSPSAGSRSNLKFCPCFNMMPASSLNLPHRCFGPCMSARIPIGCLYFASRLRIRFTSSVFSACSPWEKFSLKTSTPHRNNRSSMASSAEAGPTVATCLAPFRLARTVRPSIVCAWSMKGAQGASSKSLLMYSAGSSQIEHRGPSISKSSNASSGSCAGGTLASAVAAAASSAGGTQRRRDGCPGRRRGLRD